jgi:hypothetical protein
MDLIALPPLNGHEVSYHGQGVVYSIRCSVNNRLYIGSTHLGVYDGTPLTSLIRIKDHLIALRRDRHPKIEMQIDWNKYGENLFEFSVLEVHLLTDLYRQTGKFRLRAFLSQRENLQAARLDAYYSQGHKKSENWHKKYPKTVKDAGNVSLGAIACSKL